MINIHFKIRQDRIRRFDKNLEAWNNYLSKLTGDLLKHEAALTALEFINRTSPIVPGKNPGLIADARKVGEKAVERDIRSIFKPTDETLLGAVDTAYGSLEAFEKWKRKPIPKTSNPVIQRIWQDADIPRAYEFAKKYLSNVPRTRGISDAGHMKSVHERERNATRLKGRVTRGGGPSQEVRREPYYADAAIIQRYVAEKKKSVGKAKSGWAEVIAKIGNVTINGKQQRPPRVPAWVRRHRNSWGSLIPGRKRVTIINDFGNFGGIAAESKTVEEVITARNIRINNNPYPQRELNRAIRIWNQRMRQINLS